MKIRPKRSKKDSKDGILITNIEIEKSKIIRKVNYRICAIYYIIFNYRQAATKKQLEQMRAEDSNFESMMEGNDSLFATNLQEPLVTSLANPETTTTEKSGQSARIKPSNNNFCNKTNNSHDIKYRKSRKKNLHIDKIFERIMKKR